MKLPRVNHGRRGPKRLGIARKIAAEGRKNWHGRASMVLDGVGGGSPSLCYWKDGKQIGKGNCYICTTPEML